MIAEPQPAATVLLLRDGAAGLEVFLLERHSGLAFAPGALVFPGGRVDADDWHGQRHSAAAETTPDLPFRVAAIRETFEECGVLLARARGEQACVSAARAREVQARYRGIPFQALIAAEGLELATDLLIPFAHWITPVTRPRRFDTRFFLATLPEGQEATHDGAEAIASVWRPPQTVVDEADRGGYRLVFATRLNLLRLSAAPTVEAALAAARRQPIEAILPDVVETPDGTVLRIPAGLGYAVIEMPAGKTLLG